MRKGGYGFQGQLIRKTGMKKRSILIRISNPIRILRMVRGRGLEPPRRSTHAPQTCLSAGSSTLAYRTLFSIPLSAELVNCFLRQFGKISPAGISSRKLCRGFGFVILWAVLYKTFPAPPHKERRRPDEMRRVRLPGRFHRRWIHIQGSAHRCLMPPRLNR